MCSSDLEQTSPALSPYRRRRRNPETAEANKHWPEDLIHMNPGHKPDHNQELENFYIPWKGRLARQAQLYYVRVCGMKGETYGTHTKHSPPRIHIPRRTHRTLAQKGVTLWHGYLLIRVDLLGGGRRPEKKGAKGKRRRPAQRA